MQCLTLALGRPGFYSIFSAWHPMEVFLAERTRDEKNQESLAVISKCKNAGTKVSPASEFLRFVNCVSPLSAFRHPGRPVKLVTS